ncbi:MAG: hypothetical protein II816_02030 [Elusimicrobia bacterium]|nr:hypothetical protein [Elusimicrobiota bacterium]
MISEKDNINKINSAENYIDKNIIFVEDPIKSFKNIVIETLNIKQNKKNFGKIIIPYGVFVETHELEVAKILNKLGKDVEFLLPNRLQFSKTPDIKMNNILWEIKSPKGNSSRTIENNLRCALKQSKYIVIDLRRIKIDETKAIAQIKKQFVQSKIIKNIIIIRQNQEILDLKR